MAITGTGDRLVLGTADTLKSEKIRFVPLGLGGPATVAKKDPIEDKTVGKIEELWSAKRLFGPISFSLDGTKVAVSEVGNGLAQVSSIKSGPAFIADKFSEKRFSRLLFCPTVPTLFLFSPIPFKNEKIDGEIYCWDPQTKTRLFTIDDEVPFYPAMTIAPKANILMMALKTAGVGIYSLKDGKKLETLELPGHVRSVSPARRTAKRSLLISRPIRFFSALRKGCHSALPHNGTGISLQLSADAKHYVQFDGGPPGTFRICETATDVVKTIRVDSNAPIRCVAFHVPWHVVSIVQNMLRMWNIESVTPKSNGRASPGG